MHNTEVGKTERTKNLKKDISIDGNRLKWVLKKYGVAMGTGFLCLVRRTSGGLCERRNESSSWKNPG
jgi:hypothetical protein